MGLPDPVCYIYNELPLKIRHQLDLPAPRLSRPPPTVAQIVINSGSDTWSLKPPSLPKGNSLRSSFPEDYLKKGSICRGRKHGRSVRNVEIDLSWQPLLNTTVLNVMAYYTDHTVSPIIFFLRLTEASDMQGLDSHTTPRSWHNHICSVLLDMSQRLKFLIQSQGEITRISYGT
jgi:hypothetical protein